MEKSTAHYDLTKMQADIAEVGDAAFTVSAINGGAAMGLTTTEMLVVIASLTRRLFYKSMTTYHDHRVWQDVYHGVCPNGLTAYVKLTHVADRIVIQFKEK